MHVPPSFALPDDEAWAVVERAPLAQLVVVTDHGVPCASPVPMLRRGSGLIGHLTRANPVAKHPGAALAIFSGPDAAVSPRWYEAKELDGRVVPTWNYVTVQVRGRLVVHDDPDWTLGAVRELTVHTEGAFAEPWAVEDAPSDHIEQLLRSIVGIELTDAHIVGKAKLSQNRSERDRAQVADGLASRTTRERELAEEMRRRALP